MKFYVSHLTQWGSVLTECPILPTADLLAGASKDAPRWLVVDCRTSGDHHPDRPGVAILANASAARIPAPHFLATTPTHLYLFYRLIRAPARAIPPAHATLIATIRRRIPWMQPAAAWATYPGRPLAIPTEPAPTGRIVQPTPPPLDIDATAQTYNADAGAAAAQPAA